MAKKTEINAEVIKKYLFWSCTPIGLAAALFAGLMAIGSIAEDLEKQKKQLDTQKKSMETLRSAAASHPNEGTIDAINKKAEELKGNVFAAWETMVEKQQENQWEWKGLAQRAIQDIKNTAFLETLEGTTLDSFMTFARDEIDQLLDKANICRVQQYKRKPNGQEEPLDPPRLAENKGGGISGNRGGGDMMGSASRGAPSGRSSIGSQAQVFDGSPIILKGKVVWDNPESLIFTISNWNGRPQSFEVWLTGEDLGVYQALLWVVAESNKDAPEQRKHVVLGGTGTGGMGTSSGMGMGSSGTGGDPLDLRGSVVKQIIDIAIGAPAAKELETQSTKRISGGAGGMSGGMGSMGSGGMGSMGSGGMGSMGSGGMGSMGSGGMGSMGSGGMGSMGSGGMGSMGSGGMGRGGMGGTASPEAAKAQAMAGRYVDVNGKPLTNIDSTGPFRRMPVYLSFLVDQRRIPEILVNCANSPMPIDVLWVTVNPGATENFAFASNTATGGSMGMGSSTGSVGGSSGTRGARSMGSSSGGAARGSGSIGRSGAGNVEFGPDAVQITIYGCINIFALPDREKISGKSSTAGSGITLSK